MVLDFNSYMINESSLRKLKKELHGVLNRVDRKRMRRELKNNIITFKFRKRNGELRTAHGTLHPSYLPKLRGGSPRPEHQMVYYDLDKEGWRSFRSFTFIKITDLKPVGDEEVHKKSLSKGHGTMPVKPEHKKSKEEDEDVKTTKIASKEEKVEKEEKEIKKPIHHKDEEKEVEKKVERKEKESKKSHSEDDDRMDDEHIEKHHIDKKDDEPDEKESRSDEHEDKHEHKETEHEDKHHDDSDEKHKKDEED